MPDTVLRASDTKIGRPHPLPSQIIQPGREDREVKYLLKSNVTTLLEGCTLETQRSAGKGGGTVKENFRQEFKTEQELMEVRK